jgi:hypothetical protein
MYSGTLKPLIAFAVTLTLILAAIPLRLAGLTMPPSGVQAQPADLPLADRTADPVQATGALQSAPLMFIENVGQFPDGARFQMRGGDRAIWLAEDAIWVTVLERRSKGAREQEDREAISSAPVAGEGVNLKLSFPGSSPHPDLEPFNRLETHVSFFIGNDPAKWQADVPVWGGVRYKDLYPGVDLEITGTQGRLVPRLVAGPDADLSTVCLQVDGADKMALLPGGEGLRLTTAVGDFSLPLLRATDVAGTTLPRPTLTGDQVTSPFAPASSDPHSTIRAPGSSDLLYATYLGGSQHDGSEGEDIAVDSSGAAYVTGGTLSSDFPTTPGAFDTTYNGDCEAFVAKLAPAGTGLIYATFLGGSGYDWGWGIAVDRSGAAYVTGETYSSDFSTTPGAFDTSYNGGEDAFLTKLNASGTGLLYATFLAGSGYDWGWGLTVDSSGAAYVTGRTSSPDFPTTPGAFDATHDEEDGYDAFVAKVDATGTALAYATFLGGSDADMGPSIAVDSMGAAYVAGWTASSDFPTTPGAFDTTHNGTYDGFVAKLNAAGSGLAYATFLGGSSGGEGWGIDVDASGAAYVTGRTFSSDFPTTPGAFDTTHNGSHDAFVAKLNEAGTALTYATFLGGGGDEQGWDLVVDLSGVAYVTGATYSGNFPTTPGAFDTTHDSDHDAFVVKLNATGTGLAYASFLGGSAHDLGYGIALDPSRAVYVTGYTGSSDFPTTPGSFDTSYNGNDDTYVVKMISGTSCASTIQSAGSGNWTDPATWDLNRAPNGSDIVRIQTGHTVTLPEEVNLQGLCNFGLVQSLGGRSLRIVASGFISNYGQIRGQDGTGRTASTCGTAGSDLELRGPKFGGIPIDNWGTIQAGDGGDGERCGGRGGAVMVLGRNTTNAGTICAGRGGDVVGMAPGGRGGSGGETHIWGKWGGPGFLINNGLACGGDGGNGNPQAEGPQRGGDGGRLKLISLPQVLLDGGQHRAGWGGQGASGGADGRDGKVFIEPDTISLAGSGTRVDGGDILIFGGADWTLNLSYLNSVAISATGNITLAVGTGGVVDLRGNSSPVLQAGGEVMIASDAVLLDAGTVLSDLVAGEVVTSPSQILNDVSLVSLGEKSAQAGVPLTIGLTILNGGPLSDTYTLACTDSDSWLLGGLPPSIFVQGLEGADLTLNVTPPLTVTCGDMDVITITAASQNDADLTAVQWIKIPVGTRVYLPLILHASP